MWWLTLWASLKPKNSSPAARTQARKPTPDLLRWFLHRPCVRLSVLDCLSVAHLQIFSDKAPSPISREAAWSRRSPREEALTDMGIKRIFASASKMQVVSVHSLLGLGPVTRESLRSTGVWWWGQRACR